MEKDKNASAQITTVENVNDEKRGERDDVSVVDFGGDSELPPPPVLTEEEERRLYRKLDWRLMPILSLMYLFSFLDRGQSSNVSYGSPRILTHCVPGNIGENDLVCLMTV